MPKTYQYILPLALALLVVSAQDTWNYTNGGDDWDFTDCNSKSRPQSPINVTHDNSTSEYIDWYTNQGLYSQFVFLPSYVPAIYTTAAAQDYVYQVAGDFGWIFATEPSNYTRTNMIKWEANNIRFHYPSEHYINNTQYALEMQIFHNDVYSSHLRCTSGTGAISLFFNIGDANPFFDNLDTNKQVDLSQLITPDISLNYMITGYVGSDTMPTCARGYCWYLIEKNYTISQTQLDKLKVDSVPANARHVVNNGVNIFKFEAKGLFTE